MSSSRKLSVRTCNIIKINKTDEPPKRRTNRRTVIDSSDSEEERVVLSKFKNGQIPLTPKKANASIKKAEILECCAVSPPKQRKSGENDNLVLTSPHTTPELLTKLTLNSSPSIDKKENKFTPKKLFGDKKCQSARKALHSTFPARMPGREMEIEKLTDLLVYHLEKQSSATLYISGPPGTGKTASLNFVLQKPEMKNKFKYVYINCTTIKSSASIYSRIVKELKLNVYGGTEKTQLVALERYLTRSQSMIILVLDEIDQLENRKQSILYTIFEWPAKPQSKVILIGIANALDLTDRMLPRLQARCELKPQIMQFAPYSKQQIVQIFTERLREANVLDVFAPVAIQMLAAKVSVISGDVRRALDIGRRVIELAEQHRSKEVLKPLENLSPPENAVGEPNANKVHSVDLKQVVNVLNKVYGTSQNLDQTSGDTIPLQQKIITCSLLLILNKARNKDVTIGKLHDVYRKVCTKRNLLAVDQAEFVGLCSLIETRGIIRVTGKKEPRLHKVNLEWDQDEVAAALKDKQLMSTILQDNSCLGKL